MNPPEWWIAGTAAADRLLYVGYRNDRDDLRQIALFAAWRATKTYRVSEGEFRSWLYFHALNAIRDALRTREYGSTLTRTERRALRAFDSGDRTQRIDHPVLVSLDKPIVPGSEATAADFIASGEDIAGDQASNENLDDLMSLLTKREAALMNLYLFDGYSEVEIGAAFGISGSRVSQVLTQALGKLGRAIDREGIIDGPAAQWLQSNKRGGAAR